MSGVLCNQCDAVCINGAMYHELDCPTRERRNIRTVDERACELTADWFVRIEAHDRSRHRSVYAVQLFKSGVCRATAHVCGSEREARREFNRLGREFTVGSIKISN